MRKMRYNLFLCIFFTLLCVMMAMPQSDSSTNGGSNSDTNHHQINPIVGGKNLIEEIDMLCSF